MQTHRSRFVLLAARYVVPRGRFPDKKTTKKAKKPSEMEQVDKILHLLPHEELKAFVRDYCKKDKQVRGQFLFSYMDLCVEQKELYAQQIQALIKSYSDRYGFIEYRDAANLGRSVCGLLDEAADWPQRGKTAQAIYLAEATIEKMADVINNTDDSSGEIGGCISTATQMLADLAESGLTSPLREELYQGLSSNPNLRHYKVGTGILKSFILPLI